MTKKLLNLLSVVQCFRSTQRQWNWRMNKNWALFFSFLNYIFLKNAKRKGGWLINCLLAFPWEVGNGKIACLLSRAQTSLYCVLNVQQKRVDLGKLFLSKSSVVWDRDNTRSLKLHQSRWKVTSRKNISLPPTNFRVRQNTDEVADSGQESELAIADVIRPTRLMS